jgi:hypothetical protein
MTKEEYDQKKTEIEEWRNKQGDKMEEIAGKEEMEEGDFEAYHEARSNVDSANKELEYLDAEYEQSQREEQGVEQETEQEAEQKLEQEQENTK